MMGQHSSDNILLCLAEQNIIRRIPPTDMKPYTLVKVCCLLDTCQEGHSLLVSELWCWSLF
jgi:hypothetical protein